MAKAKNGLTPRVRERLLALRREHQMPEAAIARAAGLVQQDVNRFFTGDMKLPRLEFLDALCRVFGYTLADVLADVLPPPALPKELSTIVTHLKGMTPKDRALFEGLILRQK